MYFVRWLRTRSTSSVTIHAIQKLIIRTLYDAIRARGLAVPGVPPGVVETFPLYEVLDGKTSGDYVQRVEPSVLGGKKMADALLAALYPDAPPSQVRAEDAGGSGSGKKQD